MEETHLHRLLHRLTCLSEAEQGRGRPPLSPNRVPVRQRELSERNFLQLTPDEQENYRPGRILYHVEVDPEDLRRVKRHTWRENQQGRIYTNILVPNPRGRPPAPTRRFSSRTRNPEPMVSRPILLGSFILETNNRVYQRDRSTEESRRDFRRSNLYAHTPEQEIERQSAQLQQTPSAQRKTSGSGKRKTNRRTGRAASSHFHGVSYSTRDQAWVVSIRVNNVRIHIGSFANERTAAEARDRAIIARDLDILYPDLYELNFPRRHYGL